MHQWAGSAGKVARVWPGVNEGEVSKYLVRWNLDSDEPGKAYSDDQYGFNDCFQLLDFVRALGLAYPLGEGGQMLGEPYRFEIPSDE